jgi:uncharacterized protein (TIGR03067 family)
LLTSGNYSLRFLGRTDVAKRLIVSVLGLLAVASIARLDAREGDRGEWKAIQGVWVAPSAELAGKAMPEAFTKNLRLTIGDGKYTLDGAEQPDRGTVKIYPDKKPKQMDITGTDGPNKGKTFLAIYEVSGDTVKVCYDLSGKSRPTEFKTKPGTQLFLATYQRQKP